MLISVCTIAKNEVGMLPGMLECLDGLADEIIVLDTGSTDGTRELVHPKTLIIPSCQFFHDTSAEIFRLDFSRNEAMSRASGEWLFNFDADCRLHPGDAEKVRAMFVSGAFNDYDVVQMRPDPGMIFICHPIFVRHSLGAKYRGRTHERLQLPPDVRMGVLPDTVTFTHLRTPDAEGTEASRCKRLYYIEQVKRDIADYPDDWYLHYLLVQEYKMLGMWKEARDEALTALSMNAAGDAVAWLHYAVGICAWNLGATYDGYRELECNATHFPDHEPTRTAIGQMREFLYPAVTA